MYTSSRHVETALFLNARQHVNSKVKVIDRYNIYNLSYCDRTCQPSSIYEIKKVSWYRKNNKRVYYIDSCELQNFPSFTLKLSEK